MTEEEMVAKEERSYYYIILPEGVVMVKTLVDVAAAAQMRQEHG